MYAYLGSDTELTLPERYGDLPVTSIASRCFSHAGLTSVTIPDSYTQIGSYAFYDCQNLQDVQFSSSLTTIGMGAFAESGLTAADLSDTQLTAVSDYLFQNCLSLENVALPSTLKRLGVASFRNSGVTSLHLPEGVTAIGESCFEAGALQTIFLPESVMEYVPSPLSFSVPVAICSSNLFSKAPKSLTYFSVKISSTSSLVKDLSEFSSM